MKKEKIWFKLVASVHDEYQFETKPEYADILGTTVRESIIEAGKQFNLRCPLDGEYKTGASWRHTH